MKNGLIVGLAVLIGLFLFGISRSNDPAVQARWREEDAIKICWEEQARKSLDPSTARYAASLCEELERRYTQKHGRKP